MCSDDICQIAKPERLVEWFNLTHYILKKLKYGWMQISQMSLSEDFIDSFKEKLDWKWI